MNLQRYVIELGVGTDLHGQDVTKAAVKAVRDAISRCCLCGIVEILRLTDLHKMVVKVNVAAPYPELVRTDEVLNQIPFGQKEIVVKKGGMEVAGMLVPGLGDTVDSIVVVNSCVTVYVDLDQVCSLAGADSAH